MSTSAGLPSTVPSSLPLGSPSTALVASVETPAATGSVPSSASTSPPDEGDDVANDDVANDDVANDDVANDDQAEVTSPVDGAATEAGGTDPEAEPSPVSVTSPSMPDGPTTDSASPARIGSAPATGSKAMGSTSAPGPGSAGRAVPTTTTTTTSPTTAPASSSAPPPTSTGAAATAGVGTAAGAWSALQAMTVVDPRDFGAVGDGRADDTAALQRAVNSLSPGGGIVYIADGAVYKTSNLVKIEDDHVKIWARSGRGQIYARTGSDRNRQAIICQDNDGCGLFGLRLGSDSSRRLAAREDSRVVLDGATNAEVVGLDVNNSASAAIFIYGRSRTSYIEGNHVHDSWSDSVHFTDGSRKAWVWDNTFHSSAATKGDDGLACVTYGNASPCGDMEWWGNTHLGSGWGRGFSVIGGDGITIHHNLARQTAGAGIIVASEPSYDTPSSSNISIYDNILFQTGRVIPHPGILISGQSAPISNVTVRNNVVVESANGEAFRREGDTSSINETNTMTSADRLPKVLPVVDGARRAKSTDILKTRDTSFVDQSRRRGLYRIHVQRAAQGGVFQQRFEYVVAGPGSAVDRWLASSSGAVVERSTVGSEVFAVVLTPVPSVVPNELRPVPFAELRRGDRQGGLRTVWAAVNR